MADFIPYGRQHIDDEDIEAVVRVLKSDMLTTGPEVARFEDALKATIGAEHVVVCSSGTAALHLACLALGLGPGDTAIVPSITFMATANAVRYTGAEVVFADVDPDSGLMEPEQLAAALDRAGGDVRAIFPVHLSGQGGDLAGLKALADEAGAALVSDACHALGMSYRDGQGGAGDGRFEVMSCFSFHPVKAIAMGEGGAIATNDAGLAARLVRHRSHGIIHDPAGFRVPGQTPGPWYHEMPEPGFNYRASDILCALGRSQLAKLSDFIDRRRKLAGLYDAALAPLTPHVVPLKSSPYTDSAYHLYVALIDFEGLGVGRAEVMASLREAGIGSQVHYIPVHRQPYYVDLYGDQHLPGAEAYYARALSLPLYPGLAEGDPARVATALAAALGLN